MTTAGNAELVRRLREALANADEGLANAYSTTYDDYNKDRLACERIGLQKAIKIVEAAALEATASPVVTAPPARGQVEVKALEWCDEDRGTLAYPDIGEYRIEDQGKNWTEDRYWLSYAGRVIQKYGTFEAAKAAAQADYERRILSALTSPAEPAPATGGEA